MMERLLIHETKYSPRVELSPEGKISIQGRSLIEDPYAFYNPILAWAQSYSSKTLDVEINLEYLNTSSSKLLFSLLMGIQDNFKIENATVKWYYGEDDEDGLELGKEFESQMKIPFNFYAYSEAV
jgi:hypothetical protein